MINVLTIVNTHGVRGDVKAVHYTDGESFFKSVKTLYTKDGSRSFTIDGWRFHKGSVLLKLRGIDDMNAAESLKGLELYAREEDLPPLPDGKYYYFQLSGLNALLPDGTVFGKVSDVTDGPGGELLEITKTNGKKCLIPKCDAFVKEISLEKGEISITPIEGLIDDEI
ncbi:MAG: ribosome maturation factor RimM [Clostridia bacterium]